MDESLTKVSCHECGSLDVHSIEFRTDYNHPRTLNALNDNPWIEDEDLPHYLDGKYCHSCMQLVSVDPAEEGSNDTR
jgi:hypothetical protein